MKSNLINYFVSLFENTLHFTTQETSGWVWNTFDETRSTERSYQSTFDFRILYKLKHFCFIYFAFSNKDVFGRENINTASWDAESEFLFDSDSQPWLRLLNTSNFDSKSQIEKLQLLATPTSDSSLWT